MPHCRAGGEAVERIGVRACAPIKAPPLQWSRPHPRQSPLSYPLLRLCSSPSNSSHSKPISPSPFFQLLPPPSCQAPRVLSGLTLLGSASYTELTSLLPPHLYPDLISHLCPAPSSGPRFYARPQSGHQTPAVHRLLNPNSSVLEPKPDTLSVG